MIARTLGKFLRGKATTPQILVATVLAGMLGFVPGFVLVQDLGGGFRQAPGLILSLLFLVVVLNANLTVFGITLALAKLTSLVLLPVSFAVGRFLLDGPLQGLFQALVNAPVFAWFGLEYYATSGGLVVGLAFGAVLGWLVARGLRAFRARMAGLEEGSERFQSLTKKRSVRLLTWALLGKGKGKASYQDLLDRQSRGLPIRIAGVVAVAIVGAGIWFLHASLAGPWLRGTLQGGLQSWNGATVDLARATVDLGKGEVALAGLAVADAQALDRDSFRADALELQIGTRDLLGKRFVIDKIVSRDASTGGPRATPGERVVVVEPPPPPPATEGGKTLDDYLAEARQWQERLQQISRWLQVLSGGDEPAPTETPEQRERRIAIEAEELGLVRVAADHLIADAPLVLVRELVFDGVRAERLAGDLLDVRAKNLSTNPRLVDAPLELTIKARSGKFAFAFSLDAKQARAAKTTFEWRGLSVDDVAGQLRSAPIQGGTLDLRLSGTLDCGRPEGVFLDLPLAVALHGTTLSLPGLPPTKVDDFTLPLGLRGPLGSPRVTIDDGKLADALVAAGKRELADQVRSRAAALLEGKVPGIGGVLDGKAPEQAVDDAKAQAEAAAKQAAEEARKKAEEELKKKLPGGLFGGKKG